MEMRRDPSRRRPGVCDGYATTEQLAAIVGEAQQKATASSLEAERHRARSDKFEKAETEARHLAMAQKRQLEEVSEAREEEKKRYKRERTAAARKVSFGY